MGKNEEKWLRNCDFFRFSHMVTLVSFSIAYWTYWPNFKSIGALKLDLYGLLYFHTFNIRKSREENAKWENEQFIRKKWKSFCSIDLKVYKHLQTYKTHLHTKFERILSCLSGILGAFSGIFIIWRCFDHVEEYGFYEKPRTAVKSEPVTRLLQFFSW